MRPYAVFCLMASVPCLHAANVITQWNSNIPSARYQILGDAVTILANEPGEVFSFNAFDSADSSVVGNIDSITVGAGVTGVLRIAILPDPSSSRTYGAVNVKKIDFSTLVNPEIVGLKISGDLGSTTSGDDIVIGINSGNNRGNLTANLEVGGDLNGELVFGNSTGVTVTIGGDLNDRLLFNQGGTINVNGAGPHAGILRIADAHTGTITIHGNHTGAIEMPAGCISGGVMAITGDQTGSVGDHAKVAERRALSLDNGRKERIPAGLSTGSEQISRDQVGGSPRLLKEQ